MDWKKSLKASGEKMSKLFSKLGARQTAAETSDVADAPQAATNSSDYWRRLDDVTVEHTIVLSNPPYRIVENYDFKQRRRVMTSENLTTGDRERDVCSFADFNQNVLQKADFVRRGGQIPDAREAPAEPVNVFHQMVESGMTTDQVVKVGRPLTFRAPSGVAKMMGVFYAG